MPSVFQEEEKLEVFAYHGKSDQVISFGSGKATSEALRELGIDIELIALEGGHHVIFKSGKDKILTKLSDLVAQL